MALDELPKRVCSHVHNLANVSTLRELAEQYTVDVRSKGKAKTRAVLERDIIAHLTTGLASGAISEPDWTEFDTKRARNKTTKRRE